MHRILRYKDKTMSFLFLPPVKVLDTTSLTYGILYYIFFQMYQITIIKYCRAVLDVTDRLHAEYGRLFETCDKKESKISGHWLTLRNWLVG